MNSADQPFVLDARDQVFVRADGAPFAYSDGSEVERRMYEILSATADLSTNSAELKAHISDWPTEYHFSAVRHNLLRHLPIGPHHRILEIGAGCGSMSRLFGETGAHVVSVEGSLARARCARMRCRELANVEVYCSNLQDCRFESKFDVVTLIGVLEYAPLYIDGENPSLACLSLAIEHLRPDGVLIVAIENQLGLKYFCGYPEDHVSQPYFGIKDLYNSRTVRTMGKAELTALLKRAGLPHVEFQYPFPDYKLPSMVFLERAFETTNFRPEEIIQQMRSRDYTGVQRDLVPEHLVWPVVGRNGLTRDLSNSFLVCATFGPDNPLASRHELLAVRYTNDRAHDFNTTKQFSIDGNGDIWVARMASGVADVDRSPLSHVATRERFIDGTHLGAELSKCVEIDDWAGFVERVRTWIGFLQENVVPSGPGNNPLEAELPSNYVDCIPSNIVVRGADLYYVDREWTINSKLFTGTVILRFFMGMLGERRSADFLVRNLNGTGAKGTIGLIFKFLGLEMTDTVVQNYVELANTINSLIYPQKPMVRAEDIWVLVRPQPEVDVPSYKRAFWLFRERIVLSARHLAKAIRVWWR